MIVGHNTTVERIAQYCGGRISTGNPAAVIESITTDSRELGSRNLFIPLAGEKFDGHNFIAPLSEGGSIMSYLTMREGYAEVAARCNIAEIRCDDTLRALGAIAAHHRESVDPEVVGITGTNGKTTTKELVFALLSSKKKCHKNEKNYNNEIGVPMTLLELKPGHEMAVIEMGMNHAGEIERLSRISRPDLALITSVGEGHLEFLGSVENVARAKAEIMLGMNRGSLLLANGDMDFLDIVTGAARKLGIRVKTYGLGPGADIRPDSYELTRDSVIVRFGGEDIRVPLYGIHNVYNVLAAMAVALEYGITPRDMKESLSGFENVAGRGQVIDRGYIVIDDTYNANPLSVTSALRSTAEIFPSRRKIAVLSDMNELGTWAESCHVRCGRAVREYGFDILLVCGAMAKFYVEGAAGAGFRKEDVRQFDTKKELADYLVSLLDGNDVVMVKGSRSTKMEEVVRALTGKGE